MERITYHCIIQTITVFQLFNAIIHTTLYNPGTSAPKVLHLFRKLIQFFTTDNFASQYALSSHLITIMYIPVTQTDLIISGEV